jgi:hypothetical protein
MFLLFFLPILKERMHPKLYDFLYKITYCKKKNRRPLNEEEISGSINSTT